MLLVEQLGYRYGRRTVLNGVDLQVCSGQITSLVGPNGAGKSTLLKCVNRILRPLSGRTTIAGRPAESFGRREMARTVSYVPQQAGPGLSLPVFDMVALGRLPHRGLHSSRHDRDVVMSAMERLNLRSFALRPYAELSGGERQRVLIARALAQEGQLMLLDEPTNNLDLRHQLETMSLIASLARERAMAVLIAIHDLSLAARFSDQLVMLRGGEIYARGRWQDVLTARNLEQVYGVSAAVGEDGKRPYILPVALNQAK
jgi:iron complex transport system ATP-binding protein